MVDPKALGNEPASPVAGATETVQVNPSQQEGLSKREYFAGLAMMGLPLKSDSAFSEEDRKRKYPATDAAWVASAAVRYSDALLAALAKDGQP